MAVVIAKFSNSMDVSSQSIDASQRRDHNEALIAKEGQGGKGNGDLDGAYLQSVCLRMPMVDGILVRLIV